jgi:hypothetical protein
MTTDPNSHKPKTPLVTSKKRRAALTAFVQANPAEVETLAQWASDLQELTITLEDEAFEVDIIVSEVSDILLKALPIQTGSEKRRTFGLVVNEAMRVGLVSSEFADAAENLLSALASMLYYQDTGDVEECTEHFAEELEAFVAELRSVSEVE